LRSPWSGEIFENDIEKIMSKFKNFIHKRRRGVIYLILITVSFVLIFSSGNKVVLSGKNIFYSIIYPFQFIANSTGNFIQNTLNSISQLNKIKKELDKTRSELDSYKKVIVDFNELNSQIQSLKNLLKLKESMDYQIVACEVIGRDYRKMNEVVFINKGSSSGIKENMPVISYAGGKRALVGKIAECSLFSSKVVTLNNPNYSVGALIVSDRTQCLIKGDNTKNDLVKLLYIPKDFTLKENKTEYVYTSGDSMIYPRGLEIGKIEKIIPSERYENFNEAEVRISTELTKLEYVLVLKTNYKEDDFQSLEIPE
jgi:rod shape-determining protein MreC